MNHAAPTVPLSCVPLIFDFPIRRIIAHRHLNDAESTKRTFLELFPTAQPYVFSLSSSRHEEHLLARHRETARGQ